MDIKKAREVLGFSQSDFSVLLGIKRCNLSLIENGKRNTSKPVLALINLLLYLEKYCPEHIDGFFGSRGNV